MILEDEHAQLIDQPLIVLFQLLLQGEFQLRNVFKLMLAEMVALFRLDSLFGHIEGTRTFRSCKLHFWNVPHLSSEIDTSLIILNIHLI